MYIACTRSLIIVKTCLICASFRFSWIAATKTTEQTKKKHCEIKRIIAVDYKDDDRKVLQVFKYRSNAKN